MLENAGLIHQLVEFQAARLPDRHAVVAKASLSYQDLNQQANQLAHYLQSVGVGPEVLVGICVDRSPSMVVAVLAVLKAGGAYLPLDPAYPQERLEFMLPDANARFVLTQQPLGFDRHLTRQVQTIDLNDRQIASQPTHNPTSSVQSSNLAYVIYTSGSTGKPKGVAIEHRHTVAFIKWAKSFFTAAQLEGVLAATSLCFDLSVFELFVTLSAGGTVILVQNALDLPFPQAEITLINTVPSAIGALLKANGIPRSVSTINLAGEPLQSALVQQLYRLDHIQQVFNLYGPTEDTTYSTVALTSRTESPSIGQPIAQTQAFLLDSDLNPVPKGTEGELYIGGAGVARGYLNRPELTAERFITLSDGIRVYKTGDLAVYLPSGDLKFLGRIDDQVKIRGFRVELGEIEATLRQHPQVDEAIVVAQRGLEQRLVGYVVPARFDPLQTNPSQKQVQQWQTVWNATYGQPLSSSESPSESLSEPIASVGWNDSFTGLPMPAEQVSEWVDCTIDRILALKPQRVLEIGCGKGLLLFRIAPQVSKYCGIDLSSEAIGSVKQRLSQQPALNHVEVFARPAHELDDFEAGFDTVIINSVVQYFPGVEYLVQVLEKVVKLVSPGGRVFVGDVRNIFLQAAFHTGVQLHQTDPAISVGQLKTQIQTRIDRDRELVLHPDFFAALQRAVPRISQVQTQLKRGHTTDELTRFRSDVILHVETEMATVMPSVTLDWQQRSIADVAAFLQQQPESLRLTSVPDQRISQEIEAVRQLQSASAEMTWGTLKDVQSPLAIHPEAFWELGQTLSYQVHITWTAAKTPGRYDVIFHRPDTTVVDDRVEVTNIWSEYANNPLQTHEKSSLLLELKSFLKAKLPDYMVPSIFVALEKFPLTLNGKIDRRSLPQPRQDRPVLMQPYVAPVTLLEKQLAQVWSEVLGIEGIGIDDSFFELGGHSLLVAQLLSEVSEAIDIELPIFYLLQEPTIAGLVNAIDRLQQNPVAHSSVQVAWQHDIQLDSSIWATPIDRKTKSRRIFLTGATGFLGAFLLHELAQTSADIYCLVRAETQKAARQKIQSNLEQYQLPLSSLKNMIPVLGDLAEPLLGLTAETFQAIGSQIEAIYHCGASVNLVYPYEALRAANVLGTQEILRLASQGAAVHYISTIDVLKSLTESGRLVGEDEQVGGADLEIGYTQTKWVGEKLMMAAQSRGIPVCIYRPGMLTGHEQTGASPGNDLMGRIIRGIIQLQAAPDLDQQVNMTPINYASRAIVHLSRQPQSIGKAFHIINPQVLSWRQLIQDIRSFGYPVRLLPHSQWQAALSQAGKTQAGKTQANRTQANGTENALAALRSLFTETTEQGTYLETFLQTAGAFDCQNTLAGLAATDIRCPAIDTAILRNYLNYFIQTGLLTPAPDHLALSYSC